VIAFGTGGQPAGDIALNGNGSRTVLMNVSPNSSPGYFISGDGQWLVLVAGASMENPVTQVYHLSGTRALPTAFSVPPQVGTTQQSGSGILGFTESDQLLVLNDLQQLWEVSVTGKTAHQFAPHSPSFGAGIVDEVQGTAQDGFIAASTDKYDSNGVPASSTDLLSPSGKFLHIFPDGRPLAFSPDGSALAHRPEHGHVESRPARSRGSLRCHHLRLRANARAGVVRMASERRSGGELSGRQRLGDVVEPRKNRLGNHPGVIQVPRSEPDPAHRDDGPGRSGPAAADDLHRRRLSASAGLGRV
jgi:hypothetical protein